MRIDKNGIKEENKEQAVHILNFLRAGNRVIGNPAQGLKTTLSELEEQRDSVEISKLDWALRDRELEDSIAKLKAGIEGEKNLASFLSQLLKYNDDLDGVIAFASLSQEQENNDKDYIPDSDFVLIHNDKLLIIDAKNISTSPKTRIHLEGRDIITDGKNPKTLLEGINSSEKVWVDFFNANGLPFSSIANVICIVNNFGADISPSVDSNMDLIHIASLNNYLLQWHSLESNEQMVRLNTLVELSNCQIRHEKSNLDLSKIKKELKV